MFVVKVIVRRVYVLAWACVLIQMLCAFDLFYRQNKDVEQAKRDLSAGDHDKAIAALEHAGKRESESASVEYNRGVVLAKKGDFAQAKEAFTKAVSSADPQIQEQAFLGHGIAALSEGDEAVAIESFSGALRLNPQNRPAKWNLELALKRKKKKDDEAEKKRKEQEEKNKDQDKQDQDKQDQDKQDQDKQDQDKQDQDKQDQDKQDQDKQDQDKQDQDKQDQDKQDQDKQDQNKQDQNKQDQDKQDQNKQDQNKQDQNKQDQEQQDRQQAQEQQQSAAQSANESSVKDEIPKTDIEREQIFRSLEDADKKTSQSPTGRMRFRRGQRRAVKQDW